MREMLPGDPKEWCTWQGKLILLKLYVFGVADILLVSGGYVFFCFHIPLAWFLKSLLLLITLSVQINWGHTHNICWMMEWMIFKQFFRAISLLFWVPGKHFCSLFAGVVLVLGFCCVVFAVYVLLHWWRHFLNLHVLHFIALSSLSCFRRLFIDTTEWGCVHVIFVFTAIIFNYYRH